MKFGSLAAFCFCIFFHCQKSTPMAVTSEPPTASRMSTSIRSAGGASRVTLSSESTV